MMAVRLWAVFMLFACSSPAEDPFTGTWILNLSKSKLPPPLPRSQVAKVRVEGDWVEITEELVTASGERMTISLKARFDGKDYPVKGAPYADSGAYERVGPRTIKGVGKKDGKVVMRETVVVSPDGKTMTGTYSGTDATGKQATATAVFDKR